MERKRVMLGSAFLYLAVMASATGETCTLESCKELELLKTKLQELEAQVERKVDMDNFKNALDPLGRQLMLQQLFVEERIRSDGSSGLKQCRVTKQGSLPYYGTTVTGDRIASIHEHSNHIRTVGMGEFAAVLNGLEFRTRHNDYKVNKIGTIGPNQDRIDYDDIEDIPYPNVPPEVTNAGSVENQAKEMHKWFKAFHDQDYSVRDYRKYFPAILCFLEGAWTLSDGTIDESFPSDRHFIDASSWLELQEKVRFTSYTGRKDSAENYAYLPTTANEVKNGNMTMAQWNYRIICHPLDDDLPRDRLRVIDDITSRLANKQSIFAHAESRAARFRVAPKAEGDWDEDHYMYDFLDELMYQIPGRDGYKNNLKDPGLSNSMAKHFKTGDDLKAGHYHRWFTADRDAMGTRNQHRGFADETLFMARTTQPKIADMKVEKCKRWGGKKKCETFSQRWTYAIPLEIIYLSPLHQWNPYDIEYKGDRKSETGETVIDGGRLTGESETLAFNGINSNNFYMTPLDFFGEITESSDSADTSGKFKWVLNREGKAVKVAASGIRIHTPEIVGVGLVRMRYPIMPLHYEGSAAWKELTALKDIMLQPECHRKMFYQNKVRPGDEPTMVLLRLRTSKSDSVKPHEHYVQIPMAEAKEVAKDLTKTVTLVTEEPDECKTKQDGHQHTMTIKFLNSRAAFQYVSCDGSRYCVGQHGSLLEWVDTAVRNIFRAISAENDENTSSS